MFSYTLFSLEAAEWDFVHACAPTCNQWECYISDDVGNCLETNGIRIPQVHGAKKIIVPTQRVQESDLSGKSSVAHDSESNGVNDVPCGSNKSNAKSKNKLLGCNESLTLF